MACRFTELVVDSRDPEALAAFWAEVLGYRVVGREDDGAVEIGAAGGSGGPVPTLLFAPVADPTPGKVRLHIDVSPTDRDQDAELERLLGLGARRPHAGQTGGVVGGAGRPGGQRVLPAPPPRAAGALTATRGAGRRR